MADEEVVKAQKSGGNGVLIVLIALIIILLLVLGGGGYFLYQNSMNTNQLATNANGANVPVVEEKKYKEFYKVQINDMVLNIVNSKGREKLMKLSFTLNSIDASIEQLMEENKPEVIDLVISIISSRNSEELLTVGGKELLKEELLQEINNILNRAIGNSGDFQKDNIKNIFFTAFVIK